MFAMRRAVVSPRTIIGLLLSLLAVQTSARSKSDATPDIADSPLDGRPTNFEYFVDSDIVLYTDEDERTLYRSDDGGATWESPNGPAKGAVFEVLKHPYDTKVAVVLGSNTTHWITRDKGKSWKEFETAEPASNIRAGIGFHATDSDRMLYMAQTCSGIICTDSVYYTLDGFKTEPKLLRHDLVNCLWAKTTDLFTTGNEELDNNQILCVALGKFSFFSSDLRVIVSSNFFETEDEPRVDGYTIQGVTNLAAVKHYLVFAAKSKSSIELAMYVTNDAQSWHRAEFGEHRLEEDAYTLLESTNYSMQVDVMTSRNQLGVLLTSNSNGTHFTKNIEHTNRSPQGFVDFEKISNIQGIVLVNVVDNWEEVELSWQADKKIVSQISFDDGRTWDDLKVGSKKLHLHSVTDQRNLGRIFSSPAPGLVMGVGNTGKYLSDFDKGDTYVSDDAGLTWTLALEGPHIYEFGAQGSVLVAVETGDTKEVKWSLDFGKTWDSASLPETVRPVAITTTPDSTSLKFLLVAQTGRGGSSSWHTYGLDFKALDKPECKKSDFEKWPARVDSKGEPTCIMGHKQAFRRRKPNAECVVVVENFDDPEEETEKCDCTKADYECDFNFKLDSGECVQVGPIPVPDGTCKKDDDTFEGPSGYRKIPGNQCSEGIDLLKPVERPCKESKAPAAPGKISSELTTDFKGGNFGEYYYLERGASSNGSDETIVMLTDARHLYITHDHGKNWAEILKGEDVSSIYPHEYINDVVYFLTPSKKVWYSQDRGLERSLKAFDAPGKSTKTSVLSFHPVEENWLIWTGDQECSGRASDCAAIAYVSMKGGDEWEKLLPAVRKCQFIYREGRLESDQVVYCEQYENENPDEPISLLTSDDFFRHKKVVKRNVINFATMAEYIVVAIRDDDQKSLKVDTSIDGVVFADAQFPPNFRPVHQQAYTVLDSSTHAIFLHVTVNNRDEQEYGSIIKSNSNGTSYVLSAGEVNRNALGYVDFEKMQGIEGVALINRVANAKDVDDGASKKLKTYITHNDGAAWDLIARPSNPDAGVGEPFTCETASETCALHLHGYTERKDPRDTYSSASAVGMMIATGNVGEFLGLKEEADTFITRDGGITWEMIAPGNWMWEYGDQGSIIVIVKENEPIDFVKYSLDEGKTWIDYRFDETMLVTDISTVPSDTSRNFLLWGKVGSKLATVNLDFSDMEERSKRCEIDEQDKEKSDYWLWSPRHPLSEEECLFGHVAEYHRKKDDRSCYIGRQPEILHGIAKNCSCTREDFECDYNYERGPTGECTLVSGLQAPDPAAVCKQKDGPKEYYDITGYRRIPLSTCSGGKDLQYTSQTHPCQGHEDEWNEKHGISGVGLFFAIVLPIAAAAGVGYWVWRNWDGKFGRIRLGDSMGGSSGAFDRDAPWIKYPIMALSGVVAVLAALPMLTGSLWRVISSRLGQRSGGGYGRPYTSRSSFQRGDYAVVDPDDGELLGDSDEDV